MWTKSTFISIALLAGCSAGATDQPGAAVLVDSPLSTQLTQDSSARPMTPSKASIEAPPAQQSSTDMTDEVTIPADLLTGAARDLFPDSNDAQRIDWRVRERLIADCLANLGFDYTPLPLPPALEADRPEFVLPLGALTVEKASRSGYQPELISANLPVDTAVFNVDIDSEAIEKCVAEARQEMYDGESSARHIVTQMLFEATADVVAAIDASTEVALVRDAWSECMAKQGYGFGSPDDATASFPPTIAGAAVSDNEIRVATADAECRASSGYDETRQALYLDRLSAWSESHAAEIGQALDVSRAETDHLVDLAVRRGLAL